MQKHDRKLIIQREEENDNKITFVRMLKQNTVPTLISKDGETEKGGLPIDRVKLFHVR